MSLPLYKRIDELTQSAIYINHNSEVLQHCFNCYVSSLSLSLPLLRVADKDSAYISQRRNGCANANNNKTAWSYKLIFVPCSRQFITIFLDVPSHFSWYFHKRPCLFFNSAIIFEGCWWHSALLLRFFNILIIYTFIHSYSTKSVHSSISLAEVRSSFPYCCQLSIYRVLLNYFAFVAAWELMPC